MSALVSKVVGLWRGADGKTAEVAYEGSDKSGPENWATVYALIAPRINYQTAIELDEGVRILLPTNEIGHVLPDRSGVLVLFKADRAPQGNLMHHLPPNNAAIFNADGSLRFQLQNPFGASGSFRAALRNRRSDGVVELGVRVCPMSYPVCETVYVLDGSTPDISKQLPRWVRD